MRFADAGIYHLDEWMREANKNGGEISIEYENEDGEEEVWILERSSRSGE